MRVMTFSRSSSARSKFVAILFMLCSMLGSEVLILGTMTLGGMIAYKINANEKGVSPIIHRLVVQYTHRHPGSSFGHFPFLSKMDFLKQSRIDLLDASACPLPWGYIGIDMCCLMSYFLKNFAKSLPTNYELLSMMMD
ncbi:hypothetical protein COP2_002882 [Malus domestica]